MISRSRRVQFENWFQNKIFTIKDSLYQSWLVLKRASIGTETEALDALLVEKIPKNLQKSKTKRNMNYPSGPARHDCTGLEWMELMRSRREKRYSKTSTKKKKDWKTKFACYCYNSNEIENMKFWMKFIWYVSSALSFFSISSSCHFLSH